MTNHRIDEILFSVAMTTHIRNHITAQEEAELNSPLLAKLRSGVSGLMESETMGKNKICPVCGKPYLRAALVAKDKTGIYDKDHYYHIKEKLFGIDHYPPRGLCTKSPLG